MSRPKEAIVQDYQEKYGHIPELAKRIVSQLEDSTDGSHIGIDSFAAWNNTLEGSGFWATIHSLDLFKKLDMTSYYMACKKLLNEGDSAVTVGDVIKSMDLPANIIKVHFWAEIPDRREEIVEVNITSVAKMARFPEVAREAAIRREFHKWLMKQTVSCGYTEVGADEGFAFSSGRTPYQVKPESVDIDIINGNKIIADFNGYLANSQETYYYAMKYAYDNGDLKYHSDMNWLMSAIEKIEAVEDVISFRMEGKSAELSIHDRKLNLAVRKVFTEESKIMAAWSAVIYFIKTYHIQLSDRDPDLPY